jgi:Protein of unknown function, DUF255
MSVFLTPELKPFFGGTYFPPVDAYGRPGFSTILKRIAEVWRSNKEALTEQSADTMEQLAEAVAPQGETRKRKEQLAHHWRESRHGRQRICQSKGSPDERDVVLGGVWHWLAPGNLAPDRQTDRLGPGTFGAALGPSAWGSVAAGFGWWSGTFRLAMQLAAPATGVGKERESPEPVLHSMRWPQNYVGASAIATSTVRVVVGLQGLESRQ